MHPMRQDEALVFTVYDKKEDGPRCMAAEFILEPWVFFREHSQLFFAEIKCSKLVETLSDV
eukprot:5607980-Amphidinium_carterae.1